MKQYKVRVDGKEYTVEVEEINSGNAVSSLSMPVTQKQAAVPKEKPREPENAPKQAEVKPSAAPGALEGETIKAPMPGKILKVNVSEGDSVNEGDTVLILEAMKMENEIIANSGGKVKKIFVSVNDMVETDDTLITVG